MPIKSMLHLFTINPHHHSSKQTTTLPHRRRRRTFSATLMEENITNAESIFHKWDLTSPNPLFHTTNREESARFISAVRNLHRSMIFFSSDECLETQELRSESLIRAQILMQSAMRRLEKEFSVILSDSGPGSDTTALADLRSIAETMMANGYGKECVRVYKTVRKSVVDAGLYLNGFENLTLSRVQKLDWESLDLKIRSWLDRAGTAVRSLLSGERILCDQVFPGSDPIRESFFADIAKDAAIQFLAFPDLVARSKPLPEKLFRILDLYSSLSDLVPDIGSVFSFGSTTVVKSQALSTLSKLADAVRSTIAEFESAIQRDASKNAVAGGGIHPLTRYVMNYLAFLADYELWLVEIYGEFPLPDLSPDQASSPLSSRIGWLILVLLCILDGKSGVYKEVAQSYLFLMNNLHYVVRKVKGSKLGFILGEDWVLKQEAMVRHYAASYERIGWARIAAQIPAGAAEAEERVSVFYEGFEEAMRVQREWVVADSKIKEEVRGTVAEMIVPAYRAFYQTYRPVLSGDVAAVRFLAPEEVKKRVMELFSG